MSAIALIAAMRILVSALEREAGSVRSQGRLRRDDLERIRTSRANPRNYKFYQMLMVWVRVQLMPYLFICWCISPCLAAIRRTAPPAVAWL